MNKNSEKEFVNAGLWMPYFSVMAHCVFERVG
jgi:hypothetical protein